MYISSVYTQRDTVRSATKRWVEFSRTNHAVALPYDMKTDTAPTVLTSASFQHVLFSLFSGALPPVEPG